MVHFGQPGRPGADAWRPDRRRAGLAVLLACLAVGSAPLPVAWAQAGPRERGQLIASGGGPGGAGSACFTCHGIDGAGQAVSGVPLIGGLSAEYLSKQLDDYASGSRSNEVMAQIARHLSGPDRRAVSLYYERLSPRVARAGRSDPALLQEGAALYALGSAARGLQACVNCHGPAARGLPPTYPRLAGQHAAYTAEQLRQWKTGERRNSLGGIMAHIAARMSSREVRAVAEYLAALDARGETMRNPEAHR